MAAVWITGANEREAALDRELDRVLAATNMETNRNVFAGAVHVLQAAALPNQQAIPKSQAEQTAQAFDFPLPAVDNLPDLTTNTVGGGATTSSREDTERLMAAVAAQLAEHIVGHDVGPTLLQLEQNVNVGLQKAGLVALLTQQQRLGGSTNYLRALIEYEMDFDADFRHVLNANLVGKSIDTRMLLVATPLRPLQWSTEHQTWTFQPVAVSHAQTRQLPASPATQAFQALADASTTAARDQAILQLLDVDTQIEQALATARDGVIDDYHAKDKAMRFEHWRNFAIFAGVFVFGIILLLIARKEQRCRRYSEAAHANALAEMEQKAYHDQLTGLHNRYWLDEHLSQKLNLLPLNRKLGLVYLDLDGFKGVNDVWGHDSGDDVLRNVSQQLKQWSRAHPEWEFVRFGGDEFLGITTFRGEPDAEEVKRLLHAIANVETTNSKGHAPLRVNASAGVAVARPGGKADDLLLRADTALALAKQRQRGTVQFYSDAGSRVSELLPLIPHALEDDQFRVHLQPIVDLQHDRVAFAEALVRWHRPDGSVVDPSEFVPFTETYGLADGLTAAVVRDVGRVGEQNPYLPWVWINVSPVELTGRNFAERFLEHLAVGNLEPRNIGIEITETAAIANVEQVAHTLGLLRDAGVLVVIDDFGAGYTPLGHLRTLPADIIKIDGGLIAGIDQDPVNQAIVRGFYESAHGLGCDVVAEGIERIEELQWVIESGIRYGQGFLLGEADPDRRACSSDSIRAQRECGLRSVVASADANFDGRSSEVKGLAK